MKKIIVLLVLAVLLVSCNSFNKKETDPYSKVKQTSGKTDHPGKKLMETNCYLCHSATAAHDNRIGPPMIAIKKHYINSETTKEEFTEAMQTWIKNPNEEDAKMPGAVRQFGVMPKQHYPEETIAQISEYMFDFKIEQPEWFENHFIQERGNGNGQGMGTGKGMGNGQGKKHDLQQAQTDFQDLPYGERGLKYALATKTILGKSLMGTIQKKGVLEALAFCNIKAYTLTDSMSVLHNANIKRVTDKPRNPNNKANAEELGYISDFKQVIANNEEPTPLVKESKDKVKVYFPITTNNMCLQCHGKPNETIEAPTIARIKSLYPMDKASGYDINEVRGIWSISFDK